MSTESKPALWMPWRVAFPRRPADWEYFQATHYLQEQMLEGPRAEGYTDLVVTRENLKEAVEAAGENPAWGRRPSWWFGEDQALSDFYDDGHALTPDYRCGECGASGLKLWRRYQTFLEHQALLCADCAVCDQKKPGAIGEDGRYEGAESIGWLVPAVPAPEGSYWGYTAVPEPGVDWWRALPTRRSA